MEQEAFDECIRCGLGSELERANPEPTGRWPKDLFTKVKMFRTLQSRSGEEND